MAASFFFLFEPQGMNGAVRDEILLQLAVPTMFVQVPAQLDY